MCSDKCVTIGAIVDEDSFCYKLCRDIIVSEDGNIRSMSGLIMIPKGVVAGVVKIKTVKMDLDDYEPPEPEEEDAASNDE